MKAYIKTILKSSLIVSTLLLAGSCEDYLERTPQSVVSDEVAFVNFRNFQGFTEELYNFVPNFTNNYWTNDFNWGDDEMQNFNNTFHFGVKIENGDFWGWQAEHDGWGAGWMDKSNPNTSATERMGRGLWPHSWRGIRKANLGLANLDRLTDATQEERDLIEGQLLFFRGWFHFQLIQYFGGLPYIDMLLLPGDELRNPRLSYHESAEKVAADLRRAADLLPIDWDLTVAGRSTLGKNQLRINKIMALGYLGKNLLWAGSPLMNYESTGVREYNEDYCKRAAEVFGELLNLVETGQTQYALVPFSAYKSLFFTIGQNWLLPGGTEAIFRNIYTDAWGSRFGTMRQYIPAVVGGDALKFVPTANYVNFYGMANGLPLPDDISQADPESGYDPNFPWKGRDPRFYHDIGYDGIRVVAGAMGDRPAEDRYANLYTGGSYRPVNNGSPTGYFNRKFIPLSANAIDDAAGFGANPHINVSYMRLADIYLMYAEAVLMGYGSHGSSSTNFGKSAVEAVNTLRERAGVGLVHDKFLTSNEVFLEELRRERAVELAFESHRFNDLRRWLLLIEEPYTIKTSLEFDRSGTFNSEDPTENRIVNIREEVVIRRRFTEKHYWLPLKVSDVTIYPEFNQNPGW